MSDGLKRPIRVLHVIGSMVRGGAESWLMSLLRTADRQELAMDFCALSGQPGHYADEIEALGGRIHCCADRPYRSFPKRLGRILRDNDYDVIHSHVWSFSGPILKIAHRSKVPLRIAHSHNTQSKHRPTTLRRLYTWWARHLTLKHATHCLACARGAAAALFGSDWERLGNCRVLYCSIDVETFRPEANAAAMKPDVGLPPDAIVVGNVGNLRRQKNHTFFLDIAAKLAAIEGRAYFFVAGEGELRPELEAKAADLGIADRVIFAGVRNDVPRLLTQVFDVLLFPSLYEGMPLVLVEATAGGLRSVCSDTITEEATDWFHKAFTRLLLDASPEAWAQAVKAALAKGKIGNTVGYEAARNSHFAVDYSLGELRDIYSCGTRSRQGQSN